jgi:hypothetical protein
MRLARNGECVFHLPTVREAVALLAEPPEPSDPESSDREERAAATLAAGDDWKGLQERARALVIERDGQPESEWDRAIFEAKVALKALDLHRRQRATVALKLAAMCAEERPAFAAVCTDLAAACLREPVDDLEEDLASERFHDAAEALSERPSTRRPLMPATQRGSVFKIGPKKYGIRWRDPRTGKQPSKRPFTSPSKAREWYRTVIEPDLHRDSTPMPDLTLAEFVPVFLERHAATGVRPRTIGDLRKRLAYAITAFGDVSLRELARMSGEIASWKPRLPERSRYGIVGALCQALGAAVRWG